MQQRGELAKPEDNLIQNRNDIDVISVKTLSDIGLSCKESSRFQRVADSKHLIPRYLDT